MPDSILALLFGFLLDLLLGDPQSLPHPVALIGGAISLLEDKLRSRGGNLKKSGLLLAAAVVLGSAAAAELAQRGFGLFGRFPRLLVMALLDWLGIAVTSMAKEARGVQKALEISTEAARRQVARIVGRDTGSLSREEIVKAAVETVAENTVDGVISPLLYAAIGGPTLLWAFKAASTLDSMVGYRSERYREIGFFSAKLDDILNFIPARITAVLLCLAAAITGLDGRGALRMVARDHGNHLSPNCGWPESAAAGALHIQLGGTHTYFGERVVKPTIGDADRPALAEDIDKMLRMFYVTSFLGLIFILLLWRGSARFLC